MTTVVNAILLAVDLLALCGVVLWLHRLSPRYGLAPLITGIAGIVTILHTLGPLGAYVQAGPLVLVIGSTVMVPAALLGLLLIYVVQGTAAARVTIFSALGVSFLALGLQLIQGEHLVLPGGGNVAGLPPDSPAIARSTTVMTGSLLAFAMSFLAIVIVYQAVTNRFPRTPRWATPGLALLAALWTDTIVFNLFAFGPDGSAAGTAGSLLGKSLSAVVAWPLIGWYMVRVAPSMPGYERSRDRGSLDLLFGTYGRQAEVLSMTEAARQLTEDELRRAQAMISTIVSNAPIVFFALDARGIFTLSEGKGLEAIGLAPGQVVGESAFDIYPEIEDELKRVLSGEVVRTTVTVGDLVWETAFTPVFGPDDSILGATGVATDMTDRARTALALEESEIRFRSTFEQAAVGIAHVDLDGTFVRVNQRLAEIVGYSPEEMLELSIDALEHPDNDSPFLESAEGVPAEDREPWSAQSRFQRRTGESVWVNLTMSLLRDRIGNPAYHVAVIEDITDRRATEAQLRQAQKMEVVGQLTGGVAHDFNNLMTVIMGGLELARAEVPGHLGVRSALDSALDATRRGASLTQRLLAFSRRQTLRPTSVEPASLLSEIEHLLATSVGPAVDLEFVLDDMLWPLAADRSQLENALLNLALNARDAMPAGGTLTITVSNITLPEGQAGGDADPGDYVRFQVRDMGKGMPRAVRDRAFEPFFTTKDVGKGSGLGLSMVYGFVKQSGGQVRIDSAVGSGTTVEMFMPRGVPPAPQPASVGAGAENGDGQLILVVEDDPEVRRLVVKLLSRLGYRSVEAKDAHEALAFIDGRPDVDLLFTDIVLPGGMSGIELADTIRHIRPGLPVVFTTGYARDAVPRTGEFDPRWDVVEKPFEKAQLASVLEAAFSA